MSERVIQPVGFQHLVAFSLQGTRLGIYRLAKTAKIRLEKRETKTARGCQKKECKFIVVLSQKWDVGQCWGEMSREKSMTDEAVERKPSSQCANLKSIILYSSKKKEKYFRTCTDKSFSCRNAQSFFIWPILPRVHQLLKKKLNGHRQLIAS